MKKPLVQVVRLPAILVVLFMLLISPLRAQETALKHVVRADENTRYYKGSIQDLAWLEGSWQGVGLGGVCEEIWEKPNDDTMMGMFKMMKEGKPVFYEFFILFENQDCIELRLKHFNPDFEGWEAREEYVTFKLIDLEGQKAVFDGLTFEKIGDNELQVFVDIEYGEGNVVEELFKFEKQI